MISLRSLIIGCGLLVAVPLMAQAEVLVIDAVREAPANDASGIPRPGNGMHMAEVERRFGSPEKKHPSVGYPPITRWDYADFTVYFEHDLVLHSVVHRDTGN